LGSAAGVLEGAGRVPGRAACDAARSQAGMWQERDASTGRDKPRTTRAPEPHLSAE
jgi:hypothetical protein